MFCLLGLDFNQNAPIAIPLHQGGTLLETNQQAEGITAKQFVEF